MQELVLDQQAYFYNCKSKYSYLKFNLPNTFYKAINKRSTVDFHIVQRSSQNSRKYFEMVLFKLFKSNNFIIVLEL